MSLLHDILRTNDAQAALIALRALTQFINVADERGYTPLVLLARRQYGNAKTAWCFIKTCLRSGADVDQHAGDNRTALYHAVDAASVFAVRALLRFAPRLDLLVDGSCTILTKAVLVGDPSIVRALHRHCAPRVLRQRDCVTGDTYLHDMIDRPAMGALLLELAEDESMDCVVERPNYAEETPFMRAARRSNTAAMQAIVVCRRRFIKNSH